MPRSPYVCCDFCGRETSNKTQVCRSCSKGNYNQVVNSPEQDEERAFFARQEYEYDAVEHLVRREMADNLE